MNLIFERSERVKFFTDMSNIFNALGLRPSAFDWYVSDIETNYRGLDFSSEDRWVPGVELEAFLGDHTVQFVWAVFSAFPVGYRRPITESPWVDDNPLYWQGIEVDPQLPDALFEIACWDSSGTILVGIPSEAEKRFIEFYPETRSLVAAALARRS